MLIIPLSARMSLKNPPVATIAFILANCLVFFYFLPSDMRVSAEAQKYYMDSGLAFIEVKAHEQYKLQGRVSSLSEDDVKGRPYNEGQLDSRLQDMFKDREFRKKLDKGQVITQDLKIYPLWKEKHSRFNGILAKRTSMSCGFIPASWDMRSAFTHMFLHGGFMHLLGNMIFLWLSGCVIELAWGRLVFMAIYLLGGFMAVGLFGFVYHDSTVPLVGASGAIAALMGAYAVLYGMRKIKIFYSLGFYFNYTMVPGFIILFFWVLNEFLQLFFTEMSQVAYVAHIGGLSGGAALGLVCRKFLGREGEKIFEQDPRDKTDSLLNEGLRKVEALDLKSARPIFEQVLELDPGNRTALMQLYHVDKVSPDTARFHESAKRLLTVLTKDKHAHREVLSIYLEYLQKSGKPELPAVLVFSIISYFASTGHLEEAEKIVGLLMKKSPDMPRIPEGLLYLARACLKNGLNEKARSYLQVICIRYPLSSQSSTAKRILEDMGS